MVVVDFHIHVYPFYDVGLLLQSAFDKLTGLAERSRQHAATGALCTDGDCQIVLCLTERHDCQFFASAKSFAQSATGFGGWRVLETEEQTSLRFCRGEDREIFVINGRQMVSAERLEILAIGTDQQWPDGIAADVLIDEISAGGGMPVINWAPFKWSGRRGSVVRRLIEAHNRRQKCMVPMSLSETSLRPTLLAEHSLLTLGRAAGLPVLYGSDPLPLHGEEHIAGSYGQQIAGSLDRSYPAKWLKQMIISAEPMLAVSAVRPVFQVARRLLRNELARRFVAKIQT